MSDAVDSLPVVLSFPAVAPPLLRVFGAAFEDETGREKVMTPPSPSAALTSLAFASKARTISSVVASSTCSASAEVEVGRMVARCCFTVAGDDSAGEVCVEVFEVGVDCLELS